MATATKSLGFIAGSIAKNEHVAPQTLRRANAWIAQFPTLAKASQEHRLDVNQISDHSDKHDPGGPLKASTLTLNTEIAGNFCSPALLTLHYRGTDPWNRKFQTDQARRLSDHLGFEFLRGVSRGVFVCVHHKFDEIPETLEIGDHRLVARFAEVLYTRSLFAKKSINPEIKSADEPPSTGLYFPELVADTTGIFKLGNAAVRPIGELPWSTLALSVEISGQSSSEELKELIDAALGIYRKRRARIFFDSKAENLESLIAKLPISKMSADGVSLTLVPKNLTSEEQLEIATANFAFHLPFLPWHEGKLVLNNGAF